MEKYIKWKYKHSGHTFVLVNRENYELKKWTYPQIKDVLDAALEELLKNNYVAIVQGPGYWLTWDLEGGENNGSVLSPDGYSHSFCIPPEYYDQLDDEIKAKLK